MINTAYIERLNATFRARLAPLVRRGRAAVRRVATLDLADDEHPLVRQFYDLRCEAEGTRAQAA